MSLDVSESEFRDLVNNDRLKTVIDFHVWKGSPEDMLKPVAEMDCIITDEDLLDERIKLRGIFDILYILQEKKQFFNVIRKKIFIHINNSIDQYNNDVYPRYNRDRDHMMTLAYYHVRNFEEVHRKMIERPYPQPSRTLLVEPFVSLLTNHMRSKVGIDEKSVISRWLSSIPTVTTEQVIHAFNMAPSSCQDEVLNLCFILLNRRVIMAEAALKATSSLGKVMEEKSSSSGHKS